MRRWTRGSRLCRGSSLSGRRAVGEVMCVSGIRGGGVQGAVGEAVGKVVGEGK